MKADAEVTDAVKAHYAAIAKGSGSCCSSDSSCCGPEINDITVGYSADELSQLPEGANLGLGCGNPAALADVRPGETVIDLGSGAGIDCFLAAGKVGPKGQVIGIDMTEEMIAKARANAESGHYHNVEFRLGQIENLPADDNSADLVLSNCVINLVPDKSVAFREISRVLKSDGRFSVSDVVTRGEIPPNEREDMAQWAGCITGALPKDDYLAIIRDAGFVDIKVTSEVDYDYKKTDAYALLSVTVSARKP